MKQLLFFLLLVLLGGCIQEAKWTWSGNPPAADSGAEGISGETDSELRDLDLQRGEDIPSAKDTTDAVGPKDIVEPKDSIELQDTTDTAESKDATEPKDTADTGEPTDTMDATDVCVPECADKQCGPDGCGGSCGECSGGRTCVMEAGLCWEPQCMSGACLVPEGSFWMGCNEAIDTECEEQEFPYHQVFLSTFFIDEGEVTFGDYSDCVLSGSCNPPHTDDSLCHVLLDEGWGFGVLPEIFQSPVQPVVCLTREEAYTYCGWTGMRLCTEAEWEKAARGTDGRVYPWGNDEAGCLKTTMKEATPGCGMNTTSATCTKTLGNSPYGLCDMAGNAWEITGDWYDPDYYLTSPPENPPGPANGLYHVIRGGGYANTSVRVRTSTRSNTLYDGGRSHVGFRCCSDDNPCTPDCMGKFCGDDGCGGSCGACEDGGVCSDGVCLYPYWIDSETGYMWENPPSMELLGWNPASAYCANLGLGGHNDWRLPSIDELRTLVRGCSATKPGGSCNVWEGECLALACKEDSCSQGCTTWAGPGEAGNYWPDELEGLTGWYWSSSFVEDVSNAAWTVGFAGGSVSGFNFNASSSFRCVR